MCEITIGSEPNTPKLQGSQQHVLLPSAQTVLQKAPDSSSLRDLTLRGTCAAGEGLDGELRVGNRFRFE